jgi:hypothetical protein
VRNPWNEYECGNYYARAMASYALLGAVSGFRYSAVEKTLWFAPKINLRPFRTFFSTASGFGTLERTQKEVRIHILEGELGIERLVIAEHNQTRTLDWKTVARPDAPAVKSI